MQDERARAPVIRSLKLIEDLSADLRSAQEDSQRLRDEHNRLKGEQGTPTVQPTWAAPDSTDHAAEPERQRPAARVKRRKRASRFMDREQTLRLDRATLPPEAAFKGDEDVSVQAVIIWEPDQDAAILERLRTSTWRTAWTSSARGRSTRRPWRPITPTPSGRWCGCWSALLRPHSGG